MTDNEQDSAAAKLKNDAVRFLLRGLLLGAVAIALGAAVAYALLL